MISKYSLDLSRPLGGTVVFPVPEGNFRENTIYPSSTKGLGFMLIRYFPTADTSDQSKLVRKTWSVIDIGPRFRISRFEWGSSGLEYCLTDSYPKLT
jgi:hypothetical protein